MVLGWHYLYLKDNITQILKNKEKTAHCFSFVPEFENDSDYWLHIYLFLFFPVQMCFKYSILQHLETHITTLWDFETSENFVLKLLDTSENSGINP